LALIVGPTFQQVNQAAPRVQCLANLRLLGEATLAYASEDPREQLVPLHQSTVSTLHDVGFLSTPWSWRSAMRFAFGGRTATVPFPTKRGDVTVLMDDNGFWAGRTRPLTNYLTANQTADPTVFRCPADTGYPDEPLWNLNAPATAYDIPLFDMLGNSYRHNSLGLVWTRGSGARGHFDPGVFGHRLSSIASPLNETVLYYDALFHALTRPENRPPWGPQDPIRGWHGQWLRDNVAYADGSARTTKVGKLEEFTQEQLQQMGYTQSFRWEWFLRRGHRWQMDSYPSPGALIRMFTPEGQNVTTTPRWTGWPFDNFQSNDPP
jgi:hypothetical protein